MRPLLDVVEEINAACDLLLCLDMAFKDLALEERSPLETALGIAIRQLRAANEDLGKRRKVEEEPDTKG